MPPKIALLLCIIFVLYLFKTEDKNKISSAVWVPLLWMMIIGTRPISLWLYQKTVIVGEFDATGGDPLNRLALSSLILFGIIILAKRKKNLSSIIKKNFPLLILFVYSIISISWSDYPAVSLKRLFRALGDVIMVLVILTEVNYLEALKNMFRRFAYVTIPFSIVLSKYFPKLGVSYTRDGDPMWIGVTTHKNELGLIACISACYFVWNIISEWPKKKKIDIIVLFMSIFLLLFGRASSASAFMIFVFGVLFFSVLTNFKSYIKVVRKNLVVFLLLSTILIFSIYPLLLELVVSFTGRDMTFTGRTIIWKELIRIGSSQPILGTGYASFWIGDMNNYMWDPNYLLNIPTSAHNGYLDVWLQLGWIGLIFLFFTLIISFKNILNEFDYNFEVVRYKLCLFFMIVMHNITEASFLKGANYFWFIFLLVIIFKQGGGPQKLDNVLSSKSAKIERS